MGIRLSTESFQRVSAKTKQLTGVNIDGSKVKMLEHRLNKRLSHLGMDDLDAYMALLQSSKEELAQFVNVVTTHETKFFRTTQIWKTLEEETLPAIHEELGGMRPAYIWSAASSTGEEAYSMAMVADNFARLNPGFRFHITGTDVSSVCTDHCREGIYQSERSINHLKHYNASYYQRYLERLDQGGHQVCKSLRRHTSFEPLSLLTGRPHDGFFDIVLLRNVIIYFDEQDLNRCLHNVWSSLRKDGLLIIGEAEDLDSTPLFEQVDGMFYKPVH